MSETSMTAPTQPSSIATMSETPLPAASLVNRSVRALPPVSMFVASIVMFSCSSMYSS